ncbi:MAG: CRTAC1 family protein, partial [Robiginitalea sp.]
MKSLKPLRWPILLALASVWISCKDENPTNGDTAEVTPEIAAPVFTKVSPDQSGVRFENRIQENLSTLENLFDFDYFYNGAGAGVADLNNDGLLDIFFCGNQVPNKLFINKGDMVFEDVSDTAGINQGKQWSNGVAFADVNADGWLDIYISQGGPNPRLKRKNLLFLNQQDGTFTEVGEALGLADMGISTQSAFFDYDKDGDLDCIVMNENEYYGADPILLNRLIEQNPEAPWFNSSHLYRNDGETFTDVSKEAGIQRPIFGLGLSVSDINADGWPDIYLASDYYLPDALFINQGDGTFSDQIEEYTQQISYYGMGIDIADINNDALQDIFVLDMASSDHYRSKTLMASMDVARFDYLTRRAGFHYQYMYNSLQLNLGQNHFSNVAQQTGMASTDWSWSVLMTDFDLDADKDVYVTNGYRRYALDNDLQQRVFQARQQYNNQVPLSIKTELYRSMPSEKLPNLLFENKGGLSFEEKGKNWGLGDLTFSNGAAMGDLDNDGDPDLVVNNMDENAFIYRNQSVEQGRGNFLKIVTEGATSEAFPSVTLYHGDTQQFIETRRVRGYRSSHEPAAHFGLGKTTRADSLIVRWPDGTQVVLRDVAANQILKVSHSEGKAAGREREEKPLFEAVAPG